MRKFDPAYRNPSRTLCEVLREIAREHPETMPRVKEAFKMAKRMDRRLREYKNGARAARGITGKHHG